jgi:hypothetical protein
MGRPRTRTLRCVLLVEAHADTRDLYADYVPDLRLFVRHHS